MSMGAMKTRSQDDVARLIQIFSLDGVSYREFGEPAGIAAASAELAAPASATTTRSLGGVDDDSRDLARVRGRLSGPMDTPLTAVFAGLVREGRRQEPAAALPPAPEPAPPPEEPAALACPPSTPLSAVFRQLAAQGDQRPTSRQP